MVDKETMAISEGEVLSQREQFNRDLARRMREDMGVTNPLVFAAFERVDRADFVPFDKRSVAYSDQVIALGDDPESSTNTQPSWVGKMIDLLEPTGSGRVLEVGTASGNLAALLSTCYESVDSVEFKPDLAESARERLLRLGYTNISVHVGDGAEGVPGNEEGYDGIIVTAGAKSVPEPLLDQLKVGGTMVLPVGLSPYTQRLIRVKKDEEGDTEPADAGSVVFMPLMSENGGWTNEEIERWEKIDQNTKVIQAAIQAYLPAEDIARYMNHVYEKIAVPGFADRIFPYQEEEE